MPRLRKPSYKQKKFVREYLKHGNATKAAMVAYDTKSQRNASYIGYHVLQHPLVEEYMREVLDNRGMSDDYIAHGLKEITAASLKAQSLSQAKPTDGLKAMEMAAKLKNLFPAEKKQIEQKTATINLNLQGKSETELQDMLQNLVSEAQSFKRVLEQSAKLKEKEVEDQ